MQLLFEEFFKKVYGYSKGNTNSILLILTIRIMIYGILIGGTILFIYLIYTKEYLILSIVAGLIIVGELSHFIRKSREKSAHKKAPKDATGEHVGDMLKVGKSKNNKLLKVTNDKNTNLINTPKDNNAILLSKNNGLLNKNEKGSLKNSKP